MDLIGGWQSLKIKLSFNEAIRLDFYRTIAVLLKNNLQLKIILEEMHEIYSKDGARQKAPLAMLMNELRSAINNGASLSSALEGWVPYQEAVMIKAGEDANKLPSAMSDVIHIIKSRKKIKWAILKAVAYPSVLFLASYVILRMVSTEVVPKLERVSNKLLWTDSAHLLYHVSNYVRDYGVVTALLGIMAVGGVFYMVPNWSKTLPLLRISLDKYPPFSLYRMLHGTTFLMNLAVMLKANIMLIDALNVLKKGASPWLQDRIEGIEFNTNLGDSIGHAMDKSGYLFPDEKAVRFLRALSDANGLDDAIYGFANDWLEDSIENVQRIASFMLSVGILVVGGVIILILLGSNGMTEAITKG